MRVILEVISGPQAGNKMRLAAGQVLQVGRTEWADFAIASDNRMSSLHFSVEVTHSGCQLKDLGSSNGTWRNGEQVQSAILRGGDEILAGATTFRVHVEGDAADTASIRSTLTGMPLSGPPAAVALAVRTQDTRSANYTAEPLATGLVLYRGQVAELSAGELASMLARGSSLYVILDFNRVDVPMPETTEQPDYLFDWMPAAALAMSSPVVLGPLTDAGKELVGQAWGEDALVCVVSKQEKPVLLAHLRALARAGSDGVLGYCWPSVLAPLLSFYQTSFVNRFMTGIDAILIEFADLPETWQIFARPDYSSVLDKVGLKKIAGEPATT